MRIEQVENDLNECILFLQRIGFSVQEIWNHIIKNSLVPNCESLGILKFDNIHEYMTLHNRICEKKQFTILTFDNTIIYIEYKFCEEQIAESRYLILPDLTIFSGEIMPEEFINEEDERYLEMTDEYQLSFPIRIDFDNGKLKDEKHNPVVPGEHSPSHMHLGFVEGCRIPITRPISPKVFFKFLIENFYRHFYEEHKRDIDTFFNIKTEDLFNEEIDILDKAKLYFDIKI